MMTFQTDHRGNNNAGLPPPPILGLKSGDEKIRGEKKKKNNGKYQKGRREVVERGGGISEVSVY